MNSGYVYILVNPSFRDNLIKIGLTTKEPEERAKSLSRTTGVPNEFVVAYKKHVYDCKVVEALVHKYLGRFRSNQRREFFTIPVESAISIIERVTKFENSLESWSGKTTKLDRKQVKWHLQADDFVGFFRYPSPLGTRLHITDFWHAKDDGDEVYFSGGQGVESELLKSNGILSDELNLNPGDYVVWCGKNRNSVTEDMVQLQYSIVKITEYTLVTGFVAVPRITEQGFPVQLASLGSGASQEYLKFAYERANELGLPRVWADCV